MAFRVIIKFFLTLQLSALILLATGCGLTSNQIVKTQSFGAATTKIGKLGESEFENIRIRIIEMNTEFVAIDKTRISSDLNINKPISPEATAVRVAATKALKSYGELLIELTSDYKKENLQRTANSLMNNVNVALGFNFTQKDKESIKKVIVGFGSFWVRKKKADAVKQIVTAYENSVNQLADLLIEDFSLEGTAGYIKMYDSTARRLRDISIYIINRGEEYSAFERYRAVEALVMSEEAISRAVKISKMARNAIEGLKKANSELVKIMKKESYSTGDIEVYAKQTQELINIFQVFTN
ncbi:hypothetical protein [Microbulbifer epialgicus]|uniref:Lipoprotein n=1 Tax=Microbulbifer epialgicus TaxID=393907 RepID=A0ABV4P4Y7_9GAMM